MCRAGLSSQGDLSPLRWSSTAMQLIGMLRFSFRARWADECRTRLWKLELRFCSDFRSGATFQLYFAAQQLISTDQRRVYSGRWKCGTGKCGRKWQMEWQNERNITGDNQLEKSTVAYESLECCSFRDKLHLPIKLNVGLSLTSTVVFYPSTR